MTEFRVKMACVCVLWHLKCESADPGAALPVCLCFLTHLFYFYQKSCVSALTELCVLCLSVLGFWFFLGVYFEQGVASVGLLELKQGSFL